MPFESLSYRHIFKLSFPERWLPLIHLYDADLPLFPIYYFHAVSKTLKGVRPSYTDRVFGFIEKINSTGSGVVDVHVVVNKDLTNVLNENYLELAKTEIQNRLGVTNPVTIRDISNAFTAPLDYANSVLVELWDRVVSNTYDNVLPFGRLWDEVLGLTRFVASWYSKGGRKGELIQTHYFNSKFGEHIQCSASLPQVDFYLLPTIDELIDVDNPLNVFSKYSDLVTIADKFQENNCTTLTLGKATLSKFKNYKSGSLNTAGILFLLSQNYIPEHLKSLAIECFNTFDKGPQRTVIFLLMLSDLRRGRISYNLLDNSTLGSIYDGLSNTYQSPKVIHIYAQQSFGMTEAMPKDVWIDTFLKWPLNIYDKLPKKKEYAYLFSHASHLGKVERLLWVAAQARKVHSSACNDAIWCIKMASNKEARGANPLSCKICLASIRNVCPAYQAISDSIVVFNAPAGSGQFSIATSSSDNTTPNQTFISSSGKSIYSEFVDDFSASDNPNGYTRFPSRGHDGSPITVKEFIEIY